MFDTDIELRRRNRAVVEDYLSRQGESRLTRYLLFTEDGSAGLYTADTPEPVVSQGHELLRRHGEWSLRMFPDWKWFNIEVFETQDPNRFWAECDGEGEIRYPNYAPGVYRNHFIHSFEFADGRIARQREFMNPFNQLRALGIEVPVINRGGIPT
ncbi:MULTISPECIES: PhzA/PhzB family protein [Actinokineospora]|uniref:Phenazine biosynthesis protein PhzB 2 n=1 Tax=Actinokineospora fastidiosa TaxID=1816 RepID=A0A918GRR0_9PSEU|nr:MULTISPECIES: PhzA/PhzB family protein [Actinokineospora]UVS79080.1 Phenazine biosynthesis protein PhzB 2 [Actinokineospora sp. UTMC 2448]GGS56422.1 phenazine biosynthesis protein PhzB 2 [Actinokineospora fastidiosa]